MTRHGRVRAPAMSRADHVAWSAAVSLADVVVASGRGARRFLRCGRQCSPADHQGGHVGGGRLGASAGVV